MALKDITSLGAETYKLNLIVGYKGSKITEVLTGIYLPKKATDPVTLLFHPKHLDWLGNIFEFSVYGEIKDLSGELRTIVKAETVYCDGGSTRYWGPDFSETSVVGRPLDLTLIEILGATTGEASNRVEGSFWLSPNAMLSPRHSRELSFTGEIRIKRHHVVEFTLANGLRLTFNDHYRYVDGDNRETISFPELTGEFESEANIDDVNSWLETLDDFLLIVSFAARERCACVGWTAHDAKQMVKLFRRNVVIPRKEGRQSMHDGLIEASDFEEFIKTAYGQFIGLERKELIRQALYRVLPKENGTLESSYLSLYSALETLVLFSNQNSGGDLILDESEWKQFNGDAREFIRKHPLFAQSTAKRKLVYEKLPELNRISFKSAFDAFCRRFNIELSDLWPVVGREGGATLARIRNKLIHGDSFDPIQGHAFMSAREHLTWIVERSLMSILGWDFTRSKTSKTYLPHMTMYNEWHNDRKVLSGL